MFPGLTNFFTEKKIIDMLFPVDSHLFHSKIFSIDCSQLFYIEVLQAFSVQFCMPFFSSHLDSYVGEILECSVWWYRMTKCHNELPVF